MAAKSSLKIDSTLCQSSFVTFRHLLLDEPYPSSERERKFRGFLFTSYIKLEIRHFHLVVVQ